MNNAAVRTAIATAISSVTGLTGHPAKPRAPKSGDGWPLWRGSERADASLFVGTWAVVIQLPADYATADAMADALGDDLADALPMYVEQFTPTLLPAEGDGIPALMITGRVE